MMEGGGEGVVALVRWLSDAELTVGLLSTSRPWRAAVGARAMREPGGRASPRRARCEARVSQAERDYKHIVFPERDKRPVNHEREKYRASAEREHTRICPEPYASTYQVAHCGVGAWAAGHWHTEFPPQRQKPCPALGNFEVGYRSHSPAHSDVYSCRGHTREDTGSQLRPQLDRDVDAFVSSLRKYPSVTERTPSADLLERLLKTSHTRSPKESPPPSKKRRHQWEKPQPLSPLSLYANRRKQRTPREAQSDPRQKTYGPDKYPLPGPVSITAFDYLHNGKSSQKLLDKKIENFKNAFRGARREKTAVAAFPMCPVLRNRFEKHMKQYHPTTSKVPQESTSIHECSKCLRRPCQCDTGRGHHRLNKEEQEKRIFEDAIFSWLQDIPIYPNEKPHDKFIRDAIVKKLAETLTVMSNSEFETEGKQEIENALKKMPMWYPSDPREREHFKNMITESLIEKIKSIKDMKSFNQAAEEFFDGIKFDKEINRELVLSNIITELDKIALNRPDDDNTYRDLLKMKAFELLDPLPIKTFGNKYEYLNELSDELANHLMNPPIDQETKQIIKENIKDILDYSHAHMKDREKVEESLNRLVADIAMKGMDDDKAESLIKCLLEGNVPEDKIEAITFRVLALANQVKPTHEKLNQETKRVIKNNLRDMLDASGAPVNIRANLEDDLQKVIYDVAINDMNDDEAVAKIKSLLKGKVKEDKHDEITDQILELANQAKPTRTQLLDKDAELIIKGDIRDILDIPGAKIKDKEKIEKTLNTIVHDIATTGMDENKAEAMIKSLLKGKVSQEQHNEIINQVLELANQVKPTPSQPLDKDTKQQIKGDIRDILDIPGIPIKDKEKIEKTLNTIVHDIATTGMDESKAEAMIKSLLKGKVSKEKHDEITNQILELGNQVKPTPVQPLDKDTKQMIKGDIRDILDIPGVPIKDKEKIEKTLNTIVHDIATTGMDESKAEAMIKSLLKGKVSKEKHDEMTNQILELANQVKPTPAQPLDKDTKQMIKGDIRDILDIPGVPIKDKEKIEKTLNTIVHDIATTGMDESKAEAMIKSLLKGKVSKEKHDEITNQILELANQVKPTPTQPLDNNTKKMIKGDIRDILDIPGVPIKDKEKIEKTLNTIVQDIATTGMDEDKAEAMIKSLLKGKVSKEKHDEITNQILDLAHQVKPTSSQPLPLDKDTKQIITKDVSGILDLSKSHIKNRTQVEGDLRNFMFSMLSKSMGQDKAKSHLKSILKGKVSESEVEDISNKFLELANNMKAKQTMSDPKLQETLKDDITDILVDTDIPIRNRSKVEESLRDILSDLVMRGMDKNKAEDYIHSTLKGNVSDSQIREISKKILAMAERRSLSLSQGSSEPLASSTQNEEKMYYDQVYGTTRDWLKNMDNVLKDEQIDEIAKVIANETLDRQKYLQLNPGIKVSDKKESEILKEQIYKALNKLIDKKSVQSIMANAEDLIHSLKEIQPLQVSGDISRGLVQDSIEFLQENLEGALLVWLRGSPIYQSRYPRNKQSQEQIISKLAKALAAVLSSPAIAKPGAKPDGILLREILKHLEELPVEPQFKSKDYIQKLGSHMLDYLKSLQLFQDISARGSLKDLQRTNTSFMPTTNRLNDVVNDWCEAIPLPRTDESFRIQQDLANKIILKIGEMNMNRDIFNDDSLYEEILHDFVDQQADALKISQYLTEDYKRVLINQINEVKQKVHDDLAGRAYKQQLRDTISNTLPSMACPTAEDLASFELMKENLAEAFINLNYSGEDENLRAKFKRRILDEINRYVNDYLRRCPAPPVNARKLNEDLYKALIKVPLPSDESMRSEVEAMRMKDIINDWLKTIPMHKQSKAELLRTNKVITLMAQKLQEIENDFNPDFEHIAVEEIVTYLRKLPLKNNNNLDGMARKLVEKLKKTAEARSFTEGTRSKLTDDCLCKDLSVPHEPLPARFSNQSCASFIPPCGLSEEDQKLLKRIRERPLLCEAGTQLRIRKDAEVNPPPMDHGSQTEMPCQSKCCQHTDKPEPVCSKFLSPKTKRIPVSTRPFTSTGSQADVSPYILVKEYYWDSASGNRVEFATQTPVQESGRICIPSSPVSPEGICRSRECVTRTPVRPRSHQSSSCRKTAPRRQFSSACPNEYFSRPKPHNCLKSRHVPERDCLNPCRRVEVNRPRRKSSCLTCQNPTGVCPNCFPIHVCPHPTSLYFK